MVYGFSLPHSLSYLDSGIMLGPEIQRLEMPQVLSEGSSYNQNPVWLQMSGSHGNERSVPADVAFMTYIPQSCSSPSGETRKEWAYRFLDRNS